MDRERICKTCDGEFLYSSKKQKFCSHKCYAKSLEGYTPWNKGTKGLQVAWNKGLKISESHPTMGFRKDNQHFELRDNGTGASWNKGIPLPAEMRENISKGNKGKLGYWLNKKLSEEHKRKISNANKGEKCYLWRGGITSLNHQIRTLFEYKQWRKEIFKRDNYICQECGDKRGGNLNADHIVPFCVIRDRNNIRNVEDALRCNEFWDTNNGRTLCRDCHMKTSTFGKRALQYTT